MSTLTCRSCGASAHDEDWEANGWACYRCGAHHDGHEEATPASRLATNLVEHAPVLDALAKAEGPAMRYTQRRGGVQWHCRSCGNPVMVMHDEYTGDVDDLVSACLHALDPATQGPDAIDARSRLIAALAKLTPEAPLA